MTPPSPRARLSPLRLALGLTSATTAASPTQLLSIHCTLLRGPVEPKQYTSEDYTQQLDDARVLASIGTVGDAYDNAMAESFVDSYKTELIKDRVWQSRSQLELATLDYVNWFNHERLHESLGDIPPVEYEALHATQNTPNPPISGDEPLAAVAPNPADGLTKPQNQPVGIDPAVRNSIGSANSAVAQALLAQAAPT